MPSRRYRSARSYSTSTDAHEPIIRYARAASASNRFSRELAMPSSSNAQPSAIRPEKTKHTPSVTPAFRSD
jgi:hypothetical protein